MTDKNPLAHYGGVLSEAVQESAAADVPASGAAALSQYLKDCEQHSIVPDVGGAFAFAFPAGFNLATSLATPDKRKDLVPGVMRCAKCEFQLVRKVLAVNLGEVFAGDSKTEPCPNGCGPLWPVTWKQYAEQAMDAAETMADRAFAAEKEVKQLRGELVQHPDDVAVDALTVLMKAKLAKQRDKGYGGWDDTECSQQHLSNLLRSHVDKGDPVDVANFCAFLSARGEGITPQAAPAGWKLVPEVPTDDMIRAMRRQRSGARAGKGDRDLWCAALAATPAADAQAHEAIAREQEACALACEALVANATDWDSSYWDKACIRCALEVRNRKYSIAGSAAPVVPEPETHLKRVVIGSVESETVWEYQECAEDDDGAIGFFTEQQVRALLAGVFAPAALAVEVDDQMALAFHHAITDGSIGQDDLDEIKIGLRAVLVNVHAPQAQADARDADGEAFRTAARLGLTLRFYGNCAQSGMPGAPSVYEVTPGPNNAEAMRASIARADAAIASQAAQQGDAA